MADSASELESDTSSIDGGPTSKANRPIQIEQLQKRVESLQQQNAVYKEEVETWKLKYKNLQEENKELRKASVTIQARAEQEEEFISNTLLKKIQELRREKEKLAMNYEQEEECLTNDLSRKLTQLRQEKMELEQNLAREQEHQISKLKRRIEKLEADTKSKQGTLEKLKKEKVELENSLEQEQEALVNKLWKRMGKLENEKRLLQEKLEEPISTPSSPRDVPQDGDLAGNLSSSIQYLNQEVTRLRNQLAAAQTEHNEKMAKYMQEEHKIREANLRLQRKLQLEMERREQLCRHLSESESSLEMDDERHYNEMAKQQDLKQHMGPAAFHAPGPHPHPPHPGPSVVAASVVTAGAGPSGRPRTVSSPIPMASSGPGPSGRPLSPSGSHGLHYGSAVAFSPTSPMRSMGAMGGHPSSYLPSTSPPVFSHPPQVHQNIVKVRPSIGSDKFVKPTALPPPKSPSPVGNPPSPMQTNAPPASPGPPQRSQSPMQVDKSSSKT